jgi:hypothetical protein
VPLHFTISHKSDVKVVIVKVWNIGLRFRKIEQLNQLETKFEIKNLNMMKLYLGVEFIKVNKGIFMMQR